MTRSGRPEPGAIRSSLADAAWRLFADLPPAGVSTRDIAQAGGCSHGMITQYYGGKAGLELAVVERLAQVLEVTIINIFQGPDWPFADLIKVGREHPRVERLLVRAGLHDLPIQPILDTVSLGPRLVARIEEHRGGTPNRPTQRSRVAAYAAICGLLGLYTFDPFLTWASRLDAMAPDDRDAVSTRALEFIAELAADDDVDLRISRVRPAPAAPDSEPPLQQRASGRREVRTALINSAADLFAKRGPAAVSVREISEHAGLQHGLIHRYFGTKESLMTAVLDGDLNPILEASIYGISSHVPTMIRLQRQARGPWLVARLLADRVDIRTVRPRTPIFEAVLSGYPEVPEGPGPADLSNPRLALHAAAAVVWGSTIWDLPVRQLVGLPLDADVDIDGPVSTVAMRLLGLPRS